VAVRLEPRGHVAQLAPGRGGAGRAIGAPHGGQGVRLPPRGSRACRLRRLCSGEPDSQAHLGAAATHFSNSTETRTSPEGLRSHGVNPVSR
jgi:hypothetical protein